MSNSPPVPDKIGRYPVTRVLGTGAMGCVYLARDTELDRDVAIKTVRMLGSREEQEAFLVRFRNEARAVGRLKHRSIVAVYDVGNDPEQGPYLVFEYVEGANLKDILRSKGPLSPEQVVALAEQVGEALDAAHHEGIIHRDIKPENLLVGRDGIIRLADFGVARVPDAVLTGEGQFLGTPCYGAPETLRGGEAGPLSDQFSFAAVLYEAASGTRAFPGTDALAVAHSVIHEEPAPPSDVAVASAVVPDAVDAVLLRGLSKRAAERFDHLSSLVGALRAAYTDVGALGHETADTVPAMLLGQRVSRRSVPPPVVKTKLPLWPFLVALALGIAAVTQLTPSAPAAAPSGDGPDPGQAGNARVDAPPGKAAIKVGDAASIQPTPSDAAASTDAQVDAGAPDELVQLSAFEREERAKDALERAQKALDSGDREAAKTALDEAFRYDPEHPEIAALRKKL